MRDRVRERNVAVKAARKALRDCRRAGDQGAPPADGALCLKPRTGHGHEGEACRVRLGADGVCQHHG